MTRSVTNTLLGTLILFAASVPSCGGAGVGGGGGTTGGASCSSVCQAGQNVAPSLGCTLDYAGCLEECGETQQEAAAAGCSAEFNALASCMLNGGAAAWECDSSSDEMEPAVTGPCASQLSDLETCEASSDGTGGSVSEEG